MTRHQGRRALAWGRFAVLLFAVAPVLAQPVINSNGVVNAASFLSPAVPGGAVAQGSIISIFGSDLGPKGLEAREFPLPLALGGVRVEILADDGRTLGAPLLFVSTSQINAILPSETPVGRQEVRVIRDSVGSAARSIKVVRSSVGVFTEDNVGLRQPAGSRLLQALRPGERLTLWLTGLGPVQASDTARPPVGELPVEVLVRIGGRRAEIEYQGRSGCCTGLDQVNVVVPEDAPGGCFVPVWVETNHDLYSNIATVSIAPPDRECWETETTLAKPFVESISGRLELTQFVRSQGPIQLASQEYSAFYARGAEPPALDSLYPFATDDPALLPPPGLCRAPAAAPDSRPVVDGGFEFRVEGPLGETTIAAAGDPPVLVADPPLALSPGAYAIDSIGGPDLGRFRASLMIPPAPIWAEPEQSLLERAQGAVQRWTGGAPDANAVVAGEPGFVCRVAVGAGVFEIPAAFLANLGTTSIDLELTSMPAPAAMEFETDGLESGLVIARDTEFRTQDIGPPRLASSAVTLPNGERIQAELAVFPGERQRGLMSRPEMPADQGMLFFFETPGLHRFWMFQTLIPLDMIWLDSERRIVFINRDTPPCPPELGAGCPTYGPTEDLARFVLELNAGEAAQRGLELGDRLDW